MTARAHAYHIVTPTSVMYVTAKGIAYQDVTPTSVRYVTARGIAQYAAATLTSSAVMASVA